MANSINVTQNKWARITQLKGRSGCLCRSCCCLCCALPALSLVRGPSRSQIAVYTKLLCAQQLPRATAPLLRADRKTKQGASHGSGSPPYSVPCVAACSVCKLQCYWALVSHQGHPGVLIAGGSFGTGFSSFHVFFLCLEVLREDLPESCSWQPLPVCSKPLC